MDAIMAPDMMREYSVPWVPWKLAIPTVMVYFTVSFRMMRGQRNRSTR
jgi:hypothetical protein